MTCISRYSRLFMTGNYLCDRESCERESDVHLSSEYGTVALPK